MPSAAVQWSSRGAPGGAAQSDGSEGRAIPRPRPEFPWNFLEIFSFMFFPLFFSLCSVYFLLFFPFCTWKTMKILLSMAKPSANRAFEWLLQSSDVPNDSRSRCFFLATTIKEWERGTVSVHCLLHLSLVIKIAILMSWGSMACFSCIVQVP